MIQKFSDKVLITITIFVIVFIRLSRLDEIVQARPLLSWSLKEVVHFINKFSIFYLFPCFHKDFFARGLFFCKNGV